MACLHCEKHVLASSAYAEDWQGEAVLLNTTGFRREIIVIIGRYHLLVAYLGLALGSDSVQGNLLNSQMSRRRSVALSAQARNRSGLG